jgi:hypothetical protein
LDDLQKKWDFIVGLDDEFLNGGVAFSEWIAFLVRDADTAFVHGANISCIALCMAAVEAFLKEEITNGKRLNLACLIEKAPLQEDLKAELQNMRRVRNSWIHVRPFTDDRGALDAPHEIELELENDAKTTLRCMRRVLYSFPFV